MTGMRFFTGIVVMVVTKPGVHENHIEQFAGWWRGEDEARGAWIKKAFELHPAGRCDKAWVNDITDIVRAEQA